MAHLIPFTADHLLAMQLKAGEAKDTAGQPGVVKALESVGKTLVADDGQILAVIGVVPTVPGVGEVFILATDIQAQRPVAFARFIKRELFTLSEKFRRIQAVSKFDDFHCRWLSWLGFQVEGRMRKYGLNGEDMLMWGKVK